MESGHRIAHKEVANRKDDFVGCPRCGRGQQGKETEKCSVFSDHGESRASQYLVCFITANESRWLGVKTLRGNDSGAGTQGICESRWMIPTLLLVMAHNICSVKILHGSMLMVCTKI